MTVPTDLTAHAAAAAPTSPRGGRWPRVGRAALSVGALVVLLVLVLPAVTGTGWASAMSVLSLVSPLQLVALGLLWIAGLLAYGVVMTASLPGLRRSEAFVVNLVGSGVSNLLPLGGAAGVAVTWTMLRQSGFTHRSIGLFTAVTGVWNAVARLALPLAGLGALLLAGADVGGPLLVAAWVGAGTCSVVLLLVVAVLASDCAAGRVADVGTRAASALARLIGRPAPTAIPAEIFALRAGAVELLRTRGTALVGGMLAYLLLQGVLMWACLAVVGSHLGWAEVAAGYACGRMLTTIVITPGGTGFAEAGAAAVLVALGGDPAVTFAGVLLFSFFTYVCEIPGGGLCYLWHLLQRRSNRRAMRYGCGGAGRVDL